MATVQVKLFLSLWPANLHVPRIVIALLACCLSGCGRDAPAGEYTALCMVSKLGGKVIRDDTLPGRPVVSVNLSARDITGTDLRMLAEIPELRDLGLIDASIAEADLKELKKLKNLRRLQISRMRGGDVITEAGMRELQRIEGLETLDLSDCRISDAGFRQFGGFKSLQNLYLEGCDPAHLEVLKEIKGLRVLSLSSPLMGSVAAFGQLKGLESVQVLDLAGIQMQGEVGELKEIRELQRLNISAPGITDASMKGIANLASLKELALSHTGISDVGLKEIAAVTSLEAVSLGHTAITDAGLRELKQLKCLRRLGLEKTRITDAGLRDVGEIQSLEWLRLNSTGITDSGLVSLGQLQGLQTLDLAGCNITGAGIKSLAGLKALQTLYLDYTSMTDSDICNLAELRSLKSLDLKRTEITDAGAKALEELKGLQELNVYHTRITESGLKSLRRALPCTLVYHSLSYDEARVQDLYRGSPRLPFPFPKVYRSQALYDQ
jgi:Leucine-rich repeat (LRR) protein